MYEVCLHSEYKNVHTQQSVQNTVYYSGRYQFTKEYRQKTEDTLNDTLKMSVSETGRGARLCV